MAVFPVFHQNDYRFIKRLQFSKAVAIWYVQKSLLQQILMECILQNGVNILSLVWECLPNYTIFPSHNENANDEEEKRMGYSSSEKVSTDSLTSTCCRKNLEENHLYFEKTLTEIKYSTRKEEPQSTEAFKSVLEDAIEGKGCEEKWLNDMFFSLREFDLQTIVLLPFRGSINESFEKILKGTPCDDYEIMKFEFHRFSSFCNFGYPDVPSGIHLAKSGWYSTGYGKQAKTFCCCVVYSEWKKSDDPLLIHKMLSPKCSFLLGKDIGQIPFHDEITDASSPPHVNESKFGPLDSQMKQARHSPHEEIIYERTDNAEPEINETAMKKVENCPGETIDEMNECDNKNHNYEVESNHDESDLNLNFSVPRYPHQSDLNTRIQSFSTVNHEDNSSKAGSRFSIANKTATEFAEAGLFYRGFRDRTSCFHCGIGLQNWTSVDSIIDRHFQSSNNCPIAKALMQQAHTNNRPSTVGNLAVSSESQHTETEITLAELIDMGFNSEVVKRSIESLQRRELSCSKERVINEILDNPAATLSPNPTSGDGYPTLVDRDDDHAMQIPDVETNQGYAERVSLSNIPSEGAFSKSISNQQSDEELRQRVTCKVCLSKEVGILFLPCSHLVVCVDCSKRLRKCPVCRKHIKTKQPMFW